MTSVQVVEVLVNVLFDLTKFSIPKTRLGIELTLIAAGKINSLKAEYAQSNFTVSLKLRYIYICKKVKVQERDSAPLR